ncbi:MAG TPA: response regulator [Pyrinomonadaceae bacterium]|nr:response regulator [Pyrinomonadaceae bacterium]
MFRVLLVDDEPSLRQTLTEFLKRAGYEVVAAGDVQSALPLLSTSFDVAVIDINLPGRSGVELLQEINARESYVPVIMITGEPNLSVFPEIVRAGAYDFLAKPILKDVLLKAVERVTEKKLLSAEKQRLELEIKQRAADLEVRVAERTAELVEAHDRLAHNAKVAALGRVAAQVAHEVRNPLYGLLLYSTHLKEELAGKLADDQVELFNHIIDTINQLTSLTEQILDFARPVSLALRPVELNNVVSVVLKLLRLQISANGIKVEFHRDDSNPTAMLDEACMRAALLNLLLNAVQAMPTGGTLSIASATAGETLSLIINDTGSGMTEERVKRIFEPFNSDKPGGLGLGMPYAKKIIEEHGGNIRVESRLGEGTRVQITLPAEKDQSEGKFA